MEEKDEFSDIILERDSDNKASKLKKLILIVSFFVLLFIIVLVVMKFVYNSQDVEDTRIALPPVEKTPPVKQEEKDPLFKQVPIIEENEKKESFEEMVKKLKEKESKRVQEQIPEIKAAVEPKNTDEPKPKKEPMKEVKIVNATKKPTETEVKIKEVKPKEVDPVIKEVKPKKEQKTKSTDTKTRKSTFIPKIPEVKTKTPPKITPKIAPKSNVSSGIYIQVLATSNLTPDKVFVDKLKSKNYTYRLYTTSVKGKKYLKILVGPYGSEQEARKVLQKVKADLNPKAFVFHMK